jgi:hypothetical protein
LVKWFQRKSYLEIEQPETRMWRSCLLTDQDKLSIFYRRLSTDDSCWVIWANSFRGDDFYQSTNQKQELPEAAMFVKGSGQNEQS